MNLAVSVSLFLRPMWTSGAMWVLGQTVFVTVLLAALGAKVVLQGAVRSASGHVLRALNFVLVPLLILFLVLVLQRFRDLSYSPTSCGVVSADVTRTTAPGPATVQSKTGRTPCDR